MGDRMGLLDFVESLLSSTNSTCVDRRALNSLMTVIFFTVNTIQTIITLRTSLLITIEWNFCHKIKN